ncbi:MAG: TetR/AcrR family transcriptional regulator [Rothia sp. (in: high G+C Gram-positive bacteria)]|nr:TetR/AcrR family transcriptional regulator [Rothia sp. (in: high G+C Gram-positive bacteria)]
MTTTLGAPHPASNDDSIDPSGASRLPKELRRQQLIGNAVRVFAAQGYHATTMDHIAAASQVTKPVLYQHFTGKRDLYLAVLDEQIKTLMNQLLHPLYATEVNRERVQGVIGAFFSFARKNVAGYRLIFESDIRNDYAVQERTDEMLNTLAQRIAEVLAPEAGMPTEEALMTARMLTGMTQSAARMVIGTGASAQQLKTAERSVFRLAWGGISVIDQDWR